VAFRPTSLPTLPFRTDRLRNVFGTAAGFASMLSFYVGLALLIGIGSSWYMIEQGSRLSVVTSGPWQHWQSAGRVDADPYTRARFARQGSLPMPADLSVTYEARRDEDGQRLHSSCDYIVEGSDFPNAWWSLTAFDERGQLIANPAERHSFSTPTIALGADGIYIVALSRDARPGNWLPTGGAGRLILMLTVMSTQPLSKDAPLPGAAQMPAIRRVSCR
jgi:hypothetical protein